MYFSSATNTFTTRERTYNVRRTHISTNLQSTARRQYRGKNQSTQKTENKSREAGNKQQHHNKANTGFQHEQQAKFKRDRGCVDQHTISTPLIMSQV